MEIQEIREESKEPPKKINYVPTFRKGTKIKIKENKISYANDHALLKGITLKVDKCKLSSLGDMLTEVVYLDTSVNTEENKIINNPYLASHFKQVVDE